MPEFDTKKNYFIKNGYPFSESILHEKTYELLSIFGSSKFIYDNFKNDDFLFTRIKELERQKISETIISIAIISRNLIDEDNFNNAAIKNKIVGNINNKNVSFRDACSKIVHSNNINFNIENSNNIFDGYLNPIIYLFGEKNKNQWKLELKIIDFCSCAGNII
jgi:hypothetical protein